MSNTLLTPDPLNLEGDALYSLYRKGLITRHLTENGRLLEALAMESIDSPSVSLSKRDVVVRHSIPNGASGPNVAVRIPIGNVRYSEEIAPTFPIVGNEYAVRPQLWVPLLAPFKLPGISDETEGTVQLPRSPWLPQNLKRRSFRMKAVHFAAAGQGDNPGYFGGMALAALALEHKHGVSSYSIRYARKLVEGFLAMEMNGRNGYLIRYDRWFPKPGEDKEIRGASAEELLGVFLGLMYYIRAEDENEPLRKQAIDFRARVLRAVSRGDTLAANYAHPFMTQSYNVKHFEWPLYASIGVDRGREWEYRNLVTVSAGVSRLAEGNFWDYAMFLTSMILVLDGGLPDKTKEKYAVIFMRDFIKAANVGGPHVDALRKNAYMAVVGLLANRFLNAPRESNYFGPTFRDIWGSDIGTWEAMVAAMEKRIAKCKSVQNEVVNCSADDQWQHSLPFLTVVDEHNQDLSEIPRIWKNLNPQGRLGANFDWHRKYPQTWRGSQWKFNDYAIGWGGPAVNERGYNDSDAKKYDNGGYLNLELAEFRHHYNTQIEGAGVGLFFLRMLLTDVNATVYPKPRLAADAIYPLLPFPGVEPLSPKLFKCESSFNSRDDGWHIHGDKDAAIAVISFPSLHLVVTAAADEDERLCLDSWSISPEGFRRIATRRLGRFDQVSLKKTSASGNAEQKNVLVIAERAEEQRVLKADLHQLKLSMFTVQSDGTLTLLAASTGSDLNVGAASSISVSILKYKYAAVSFKTASKRARVKMFMLDFSGQRIGEQIAVDAEQGSGLSPEEASGEVWIGSAWDNVVINAYVRSASPHPVLELFSRNWNGEEFGDTLRQSVSVSEGTPFGCLTLQKSGKYYLIAATYYPFQSQGIVYPQFRLMSWEVGRDARLTYRGDFRYASAGSEFLLKAGTLDFDRLSLARARYAQETDFVIAAKGYTDARRELMGSNSGLVFLCGGVNEDGRPTVRDWNCFGSGDRKGVQMVSVCGDVSVGNQGGVVSGHKGRDGGLVLVWWRFAPDFRIPADCISWPRGLERRASQIPETYGND